MRTTIRIDDDLLRQLKERSARTGRTVGSLIEDAVKVALAADPVPRGQHRPLPTYGELGVLPGIDLASTASLLDVMDDGAPLDALR